MKKIIITICVLAVIALFGGRAWHLHKTSEQYKDAIKIGVVVPLSGFDEDLTNRIVSTLKIATEELTKDKPYKIQYLFEDGKYTAKDSISAFNKLKASNPKALIVFGDLPAFALRPLINEAKIPTISLILGDSKLPSQSPYIFRVLISTEDSAVKLADFVTNTLKKNEVAILKAKNNFGDDFAYEFKKYYGNLGGKILIEESFDILSMNVRPQALKILDKNPDVIALFGFGPGYVAAFNQLAEQGFKGDFITDYCVSDESVWKNVHNKTAGTYYTVADYDVNDMNPNYLEKYRAKIGADPDIYATQSYIAVTVLLQALKNEDDLQQGFYDIQNFPTLMGTISYDKDGEPHPPIVIKQMQSDGSSKVIKR